MSIENLSPECADQILDDLIERKAWNDVNEILKHANDHWSFKTNGIIVGKIFCAGDNAKFGRMFDIILLVGFCLVAVLLIVVCLGCQVLAVRVIAHQEQTSVGVLQLEHVK